MIEQFGYLLPSAASDFALVPWVLWSVFVSCSVLPACQTWFSLSLVLTILPIPESLVEKHNFALVCVLCRSVDGLFSLGDDFPLLLLVSLARETLMLGIHINDRLLCSHSSSCVLKFTVGDIPGNLFLIIKKNNYHRVKNLGWPWAQDSNRLNSDILDCFYFWSLQNYNFFETAMSSVKWISCTYWWKIYMSYLMQRANRVLLTLGLYSHVI